MSSSVRTRSFLLRRSGCSGAVAYWPKADMLAAPPNVRSWGNSGQAYGSGLALAEWFCRTVDRIDPARVLGPLCGLGRGSSAANPAQLCRILQQDQAAPVTGQRCAGLSLRSANWNHKFKLDPWRTSPPLCPSLGFRYTQVRRSGAIVAIPILTGLHHKYIRI